VRQLKSTTNSSTIGPAFVYRLYDFFGPPHRVSDRAEGRWNSLPALKLNQLARSQDARCNQQHAFAAVRQTSLATPLFIRHEEHRSSR
jgi:hypothetical protein